VKQIFARLVPGGFEIAAFYSLISRYRLVWCANRSVDAGYWQGTMALIDKARKTVAHVGPNVAHVCFVVNSQFVTVSLVAVNF